MNRDANSESYPSLYHPELYLLEGGYKTFYETCTKFCEPCSYKQMIHPHHVDDLRYFQSKAKSSAEEKSSICCSNV